MQAAQQQQQHQFAMVFDLNKCLGCQTCTIGCKTQWTRGGGMDAMWWNIVSTIPGRGTPRDAFALGGGYKNGEPVPGGWPGCKLISPKCRKVSAWTKISCVPSPLVTKP